MPQATPSQVGSHTFIRSVHGIRYQVKDVARAVAFYTEHLGFKLKHQQLPAFANVSLGDVQILLSGPGALHRGRVDEHRRRRKTPSQRDQHVA